MSTQAILICCARSSDVCIATSHATAVAGTANWPTMTRAKRPAALDGRLENLDGRYPPTVYPLISQVGGWCRGKLQRPFDLTYSCSLRASQLSLCTTFSVRVTIPIHRHMFA
jgi:hypothetical protein